jgi:phage shock protein E
MRKDKGRGKKQNQNKRLLLISASLVVIVVAAAGIFVWSRSTISTVPKITPVQYQHQFASAATPHILIDVRTPDEFASGYIDGAVNISVQTLPDRLSEVPRDKPVIVYCHSGNRSAQAASILSKAGYTNVYDMGGILAWTAAGLPTVQ